MLVLCVAGLTAVSMQVRCVDAAREAARLAARGDGGSASTAAQGIAPDGAAVRLRRDGELVVATVIASSALLPGITIAAEADRRSRTGADGGSATLVAVAMMAVLLALTAGGGYLGSAVIARHRAQAAADLAALAAAVHLAAGVDAACTQAFALARAMRAVVTECVVEDLDVVVTVDAPVAFGRLAVGPGARQCPRRTG